MGGTASSSVDFSDIVRSVLQQLQSLQSVVVLSRQDHTSGDATENEEEDVTFGSGHLIEPKGICIAPGYSPSDLQDPIRRRPPRVLVADAGTNSVKVFDAGTGAMLQELTGGGGGAGKVLQPQGVSVTASGHVLVTDTGGGRIVMWTPDGDFEREVVAGLQNPRLVGSCVDGRIAVVDEKGVSLFEPNGSATETQPFPPKEPAGSGAEHAEGEQAWAMAGTIVHLWGPYGIAKDGEGGVMVVDHSLDRVQLLGRDGQVSASMQMPGGTEPHTHLPEPSGVAVDGAGRLLFSCSNRRCVHVTQL